MDRPTKEIQIEGHAFTVKTYATAREAQAIQQVLFSGTKVEVSGETPRISDFNPAVQFDLQNEMIAQMVLKMDGSTDKIVERCLDLPSTTYNALVSELDTLVSKKRARGEYRALQHGAHGPHHVDGGDLSGVPLDV